MSGPQFCEGQTSLGVGAVASQGFFSGLHIELYNLADDPEEKTNLIRDLEVNLCKLWNDGDEDNHGMLHYDLM